MYAKNIAIIIKSFLSIFLFSKIYMDRLKKQSNVLLKIVLF